VQIKYNIKTDSISYMEEKSNCESELIRRTDESKQLTPMKTNCDHTDSGPLESNIGGKSDIHAEGTISTLAQGI